MRRLYKYIFLATVIIFGLFSVPPFKSSAFETSKLSDIQDVLQPLKGFSDAANDFSNNLKTKLSQNSLVQRIMGYIPQSKEDLLGLFGRFNNLFGGFNRWLNSIIGVNMYGILAFGKNLIVWFLQFLVSMVRGGTSLMQ